MLTAIKNLYRAEPALINAAVTAIVLFAASQFNVVLDKGSVAQYVATGLVLLLGAGVATRRKVKPAHKK